MLKLIAHKKIPASVCAEAKSVWNEGKNLILSGRRQVYQVGPYMRPVSLNSIDVFSLGLPMEDNEISVLAFKAVDAHKDDWEDVKHGKKYLKPAFLHVVLYGRCTIRVGRKSLSFVKGDIFVIDPKIDHEVTSKTICVTRVSTVAKHLYRSFLL